VGTRKIHPHHSGNTKAAVSGGFQSPLSDLSLEKCAHSPALTALPLTDKRRSVDNPVARIWSCQPSRCRWPSRVTGRLQLLQMDGMLSGRARWELIPKGDETRLATTFEYALPASSCLPRQPGAREAGSGSRWARKTGSADEPDPRLAAPAPTPPVCGHVAGVVVRSGSMWRWVGTRARESTGYRLRAPWARLMVLHGWRAGEHYLMFS
jgi:hypothetical protein